MQAISTMTYTNWDNVPLVMTAAQAAELLNVHENTVKRWVTEGKLSGVKAGRTLRITKEEVMRFLGLTGQDN